MSAFHRTFEVSDISCSQREQNDSQRTGRITDNPSISMENNHLLEHPPSLTLDCLNDGICYAGLPDYGMRNTLSIVCTRQYPVITGVLKIGCESRVT